MFHRRGIASLLILLMLTPIIYKWLVPVGVLKASVHYIFIRWQSMNYNYLEEEIERELACLFWAYNAFCWFRLWMDAQLAGTW